MALIKCPECGAEISDAAKTCPRCGFPLSTDSSYLRQTELSDVYKKPALGTFLLICAAVFFCGIVVMPLFFPFFLVFSLLCVLYGIRSFTGYQSGTCPYCGNRVEVGAHAATHRCLSCNKVSTHDEKYLRAIE